MAGESKFAEALHKGKALRRAEQSARDQIMQQLGVQLALQDRERKAADRQATKALNIRYRAEGQLKLDAHRYKLEELEAEFGYDKRIAAMQGKNPTDVDVFDFTEAATRVDQDFTKKFGLTSAEERKVAKNEQLVEDLQFWKELSPDKRTDYFKDNNAPLRSYLRFQKAEGFNDSQMLEAAGYDFDVGIKAQFRDTAQDDAAYLASLLVGKTEKEGAEAIAYAVDSLGKSEKSQIDYKRQERAGVFGPPAPMFGQDLPQQPQGGEAEPDTSGEAGFDVDNMTDEDLNNYFLENVVQGEGE